MYLLLVDKCKDFIVFSVELQLCPVLTSCTELFLFAFVTYMGFESMPSLTYIHFGSISTG